MACIRTCDQRYLTSTCASDPVCACARNSVLGNIYLCVQATCGSQIPVLVDSIERVCGPDKAARMVRNAAGRPDSSSEASSEIASGSRVPDSTTITLASTRPTTRRTSDASLPSTDAPQFSKPVPTTYTLGHDEWDDEPPDDEEDTWSSPGPSWVGTLASTATVDAFGGDTAADVGTSSTRPTKYMTGPTRVSAQGQDPSDSLREAEHGDSATSAPNTEPSQDASRTKSHSTVPMGAIASAAGVAAILFAVLCWFCWRRKSRRRKLITPRSKAEGTTNLAMERKESHKDWQAFGTTTSDGEKHDKAKQEKFGESGFGTIACIIPATEADNSALLSHPLHYKEDEREVGSGHKLYSRFNEVVPPPSMMSKRFSGTTMRTAQSHGAATVETGMHTVHTLDSTTQIPYPPIRPPSSTFSIATARPGPDQTSVFDISYVQDIAIASDNGTVTESPGESRSESLAATPSISRSSTISGVSLNAVGTSSRYVGLAL